MGLYPDGFSSQRAAASLSSGLRYNPLGKRFFVLNELAVPCLEYQANLSWDLFRHDLRYLLDCM